MNENAHLYKQTLSYRKTTGPYQCLTLPWWVQTPKRLYPPRHRGSIEPLICGEEVFSWVAADIKAATRTVDIITWGFDPGMVLKRGFTAQDGQRYGDLLLAIATRKKDPVMVRLLVWYDDQVSQTLMKNIPGYYGTRFPSIGCSSATGFYTEGHQKYNAEWFERICSGEIKNICFHVRSILPELFPKSLGGEDVPLNVAAQATARFPTHHQKMLLIDYELPAKAVGYVMGHNSITDFWDTAAHIYQDPRRETFYRADPMSFNEGPALNHGAGGHLGTAYRPSNAELETKKRELEYNLKRNAYVAKPYQDVSARVRGPVLYDLNHNFCQGWSESTPPSSFFTEKYWLITKYLGRNLHNISRGIQKLTHRDPDHDFEKRRKAIKPEAFILPGGQHSAQLLRTQPMHGEKTIKECYANLTRQMHHYIFIQNQYIQYGAWATHLKDCVQRLREGRFNKPIYVFILTSTPERDGMDIATYDVAQQLGHSATMQFQHNEAVEQASRGKREPPITPKQLSKIGIKAVMGSLWTCAQPKPRPAEYEEIYIHSKVAIVDDAAFTVGSANLNVRSMAIDSELNILSQAKEVAYKLRCDLFTQCAGDPGPGQFEDMQNIFKDWNDRMTENAQAMKSNEPLLGQIVAFQVDRKPGAPLI
ncbi:phospholipase D-like domain-containing protein [Pseudoduganella sp. GCM10020061]|uniref:phospholipase D-like domain-containing protein n=1 Tax=Pseudoduganella sp. GCM10020061 TaxID=3317345 RepID=UPI00363BFC4D